MLTTQYVADFAKFRVSDDHYCKPSYEGGGHAVSNYRSDHPGGCNFAFADGSTTFLHEDIDLAVYRAKSTISGDEIE
jgi:prepilin-type processing-associated H-X9-DG protein